MPPIVPIRIQVVRESPFFVFSAAINRSFVNRVKPGVLIKNWPTKQPIFNTLLSHGYFKNASFFFKFFEKFFSGYCSEIENKKGDSGLTGW
jgi:hypothetical protein